MTQNKNATPEGVVRYVEGAKVLDYLPQVFNVKPSSSYYFWLMAPALIVLAAISIYPFFWLIWMSLHNVGSSAGDTFVGLKNFEKLITDDKFWIGWGLLFKYTAFCMFFCSRSS
jgi:multiple sugar transport system permease protein